MLLGLDQVSGWICAPKEALKRALLIRTIIPPYKNTHRISYLEADKNTGVRNMELNTFLFKNNPFCAEL